ncbi:MAG: ABC transporter substrate-binding protein [Bacteroidales bacterium]
MRHRPKYLPIAILVISGIASSCLFQSGENPNKRSISDGCGRSVNLPDTVRSVIALKAGALRLLCYMDQADKAGYIEGNEKRRSAPYLSANPGLRELSIIGAGNNHDTELLAASNADLIIVTFMTCSEADKLQELTKKPVFVLNYGNLDDKTDDLFTSLKLLGKIFYREERADSVIDYIRSTLSGGRYRTSDYNTDPVTAYIGGVAFSGSHGISSTVPGYPPFKAISAGNVAESLTKILDSSGSSQSNTVLVIDTEQLIKWDPEYIFLDASGKEIWQKEVEKPVINETLKAFQNSKVYTVLPFNWYTINYENLLCNMWFIGKTLYPETFTDINTEAKCREIYRFFYGTDVFDEMNDLYNPYKPVINAERNK